MSIERTIGNLESRISRLEAEQSTNPDVILDKVFKDDVREQLNNLLKFVEGLSNRVYALEQLMREKDSTQSTKRSTRKK